MPYGYTRKRTFRKRRSTRKGRPYTKRRKVSTVYRRRLSRKRVSKRLPKYAMRAYRGPFRSLGNKRIRDKKLAVLSYMSPFTVSIENGTQNLGQVILSQVPIYLTSSVQNIDYIRALSDPTAWAFEQWDSYSSKYQRAQVRTAHVRCEFSIQDESDQAYLNSDEFIVGILVSRDNLVSTNPTGLAWGDFERLKRCGNIVYKRYIKNVTGRLSVRADINVIKCCAPDEMSDTRHPVWPLTRLSDEKVGVIPVRLQNCYPTTVLWAYPFVVPLTRAKSTGAGPVNVQYRYWVKKRVLFDRPVVSATQLYSTKNYPAVQTALPAGFAPQLTQPSTGDMAAALEELKARMDEDDVDDADQFAEDEALINQLTARADQDDLDDAALSSTVNFLNSQTSALTSTTNQLSDDVQDLQAYDQQVANQLTSLNQETTDLQHQIDVDVGNLAYHSALAANDAHG